MLLTDFMAAIVADLQTNASFLKDVGTHGKVFGADELKMLSLEAPAVRVAMIGSRGGVTTTARSREPRAVLGRADTGQFRGPLQMIAFLIEGDGVDGTEARDKVIILADQFMTFLEHRTFGLNDSDAGPALVTGFDILYSTEIDEQGVAIAAVTWEQEVFFGRNLHDEDMALLTGDEDALYPSGQQFWPEKEWADKGQLQEGKPPLVKGRVTTEHTDEEQPDTDDHEEIDVES